MKSINKIFPAFVLVPQLLLGVISPNTLAQQPQQEVRKEHLKYCVSQLTAQVAQLEAIQGVMKNENLLPVQKLEAVNQILTPQQKQQLRACMQQPMPPQAPPQG
jgi:Spy/CpxP family protein refolding chaperone